MQLRRARLCLDCEEIHDEERCPLCASDAFAFVSRWVPAAERRSPPARRPAQNPGKRTSRLLKGGAAGVAVLAAARWFWRATKPDNPRSTDTN